MTNKCWVVTTYVGGEAVRVKRFYVPEDDAGSRTTHRKAIAWAAAEERAYRGTAVATFEDRTPMVKELADAFVEKIREWLTPDELVEADRLNATPEYESTGSCATHDFCDANEAMIYAMETCGVVDTEENMPLINAAWELARSNGFAKKV